MKNPINHLLVLLMLILPGIVHGKASHMDIQATIESFTAVGDSLEIVFSGTMSHVSGDGSSGDQWGFSARVKKTKLIIPNRNLAYFFTQGSKPMETHNLKDDFELGTKTYGRTGQRILITAYGPVIHFGEGISKITCGSVCLAIMSDTMSLTEVAKAPEKPDMPEPTQERKTVRGVLKYFPSDVKSAQAWNGHQFIVGDTPVIATDKVPEETLKKFVGRELTVSGIWYPGEPWNPTEEAASLPNPLPHNKEAVVRGDGLKISSITPVE